MVFRVADSLTDGESGRTVSLPGSPGRQPGDRTEPASEMNTYQSVQAELVPPVVSRRDLISPRLPRWVGYRTLGPPQVG
eukprot:768379-Hanusia_phi.AAC.1